MTSVLTPILWTFISWSKVDWTWFNIFLNGFISDLIVKNLYPSNLSEKGISSQKAICLLIKRYASNFWRGAIQVHLVGALRSWNNWSKRETCQGPLQMALKIDMIENTSERLKASSLKLQNKEMPNQGVEVWKVEIEKFQWIHWSHVHT